MPLSLIFDRYLRNGAICHKACILDIIAVETWNLDRKNKTDKKKEKKMCVMMSVILTIMITVIVNMIVINM